MTRSRLSTTILITAVVAIVAVIATTTSKKTTAAAAAGSAISVRQTPLGRTLADANGRTLYLFQGDQPGLSRLSAAGRAVWPPFTSPTRPAATGGAAASEIGTISGGRGTNQVTYNGHPLYYFVADHGPGQASGQGLNEFGARWYVVSTLGAAITRRPTAAATNSSSSVPGSAPIYGY